MKIFKWDDQSGDLGVCLPDELVKHLDLREGDEVELIEASNGQLIIAKAAPQSFSPEEAP